MEIKKLQVLVYDMDEYEDLTSTTKYYKKEFGYYTDNNKLKESIKILIQECNDYREEIISIFTDNISINTLDYGWTKYTFYDKNGDIISNISEEISNDEIRLTRPNKYKVGDIIFYIPDTLNENKVEKGIISTVPEEFKTGSITNHYTILLGTEILNHTHSLEEWIFPKSENEIDHLESTMKIRLEKIGY
jgi:hypothetical protein